MLYEVITGIFKNKYIIFIAPFLLGLSGLNHIFYYVTLTYQIYILVILLLTLLFWEPIKNNVLNFLFFLLLSLLIWSGPYSVLTVPAAGCLILFFVITSYSIHYTKLYEVFNAETTNTGAGSCRRTC